MKLKGIKLTRQHQNTIEVGYLEVLILVILIFLVWSLLSLPIILYHLNSIETSRNKTYKGINASECLSSMVFANSKQRCHYELLDALTASNCRSEAGNSILVLNDGLELVDKIVQGMEYIGASESCLAEATPIICLYAYGLCSSSGVNIQPTSGQCVEVRDSLCQSEWATAVKFGIALPDCNEFPESPTYCPESNITDLLDTEEMDSSGNNQPLPAVFLNCSESFFRENGSQICVPSCYSWSPYARKLAISIDAVVIFMAAIGTIAAITILIISCIKPKRMCKFPAVFVVYFVVDTLIIVLVSHTDKRIMHCSSRNLLKSLRLVTPFCIISGLFFSYLLLQLVVWWLFHTAILFWKVFFPFHSETFKASGRLKYVHIMCAIIGVLFPLITITTSMIEFGFESGNRADNTTSATELFLSGGLGYSGAFPSILCTASDERAGFYSLILPICIIQAMGSTMLVLSLWQIRRQSARKERNSPYLFHFGTAEKKLLLVFFYVEIMLIVVLITFSLNTRYKNEYKKSLFDFFTCEQRGHDPDSPCSQSDINRLGIPTANIISFIIAGWLPVVILVYAINVQEVKKLFS